MYEVMQHSYHQQYEMLVQRAADVGSLSVPNSCMIWSLTCVRPAKEELSGCWLGPGGSNMNISIILIYTYMYIYIHTHIYI